MKSVCVRRYEEEGGASRELKILGQIFLYFLSLSLFALLWVNVRLCWELAGTAYYKNLNLEHLAPSMPKCIKSRMWRIICMYAAPCAPVPAAEPLPWQLTRPRAGQRGCCPLLNLQLQSLVSCMMEWIITTAAWKNIIWLSPSYSPMGPDLRSLLKIDCAFNQQCSSRLSGHPAEKLEGYTRSIEIN